MCKHATTTVFETCGCRSASHWWKDKVKIKGPQRPKRTGYANFGELGCTGVQIAFPRLLGGLWPLFLLSFPLLSFSSHSLIGPYSRSRVTIARTHRWLWIGALYDHREFVLVCELYISNGRHDMNEKNWKKHCELEREVTVFIIFFSKFSGIWFSPNYGILDFRRHNYTFQRRVHKRVNGVHPLRSGQDNSRRFQCGRKAQPDSIPFYPIPCLISSNVYHTWKKC